MSDVERKKLPFSSGEPGDLHYCQWIPEHPVAWLHIMHGMSEHAIRYAEFAEFLNTQGIMVTADDHRGHGETGKAMKNSYQMAGIRCLTTSGSSLTISESTIAYRLY